MGLLKMDKLGCGALLVGWSGLLNTARLDGIMYKNGNMSRLADTYEYIADTL